MNIDALEARKQELVQELEKQIIGQHRLNGAIALINELIEKVSGALDGKVEDGQSSAKPVRSKRTGS